MNGGQDQSPDQRSILIVEDELLIALELQRIVAQLGATVIGPASSVERAIKLLSNSAPDAALLDVNLRGERVTPVVVECQRRDIPFALVTGLWAPGAP